MQRLMWMGVVASLALVSLGCQKGSGLDTVQVSGLVTLDGAPVEGANVTFAPAATGGGRAASGVTDKTGRYRLTTLDPNDGALPGNYVVTVSKSEVKKGAAADAVKEGMTEQEKTAAAMKAFYGDKKAMAEAQGKGGGKKAADLLPAKYKDPKTSGFKADVSKEKKEFNWELKK